jgi:hypothetical protein
VTYRARRSLIGLIERLRRAVVELGLVLAEQVLVVSAPVEARPA